MKTTFPLPSCSPSIEPLESRIAPAAVANIELSSLAGGDGFTINGVAADDRSGVSVSGAGDVNGDGFDDLLIGAYYADPNGSYSGASYVVFGQAGGFTANLNLSTLDGTNGFRLSGVAAGDRFGRSVSGAGDVNGDGFADLLIGADLADPNGSSSGASYVVFGQADFSATAGNLELSTLDGTNGFRLSGVAADDRSGISVSGAGDVNGDGFADLLIGAHYADPNGSNSGASYVVFGKADFSATAGNLELSTLDGTNGFRLSGVASDDRSGISVSGAGDVNGDGFADFIIGALGADPNGSNSGASYVVFGKADFSATAGNLNLSTLDGTNGFRLSGVAAEDRSGFSVSGAGDVNGDGFDDLIIGAFQADPNGSDSGASYVVFGQADFSATAGNLNLSTLNGTNGFRLSGVAASDNSGFAVSGGGDVNGDGFADLIIGAQGADPNGSDSGASYVVFGKADFSATTGNLNLSTLDGTNGFRLSGVAAGDRSGFSVSGAGDVNGDGFADLLIGAQGADPNGSDSGASYVVFGFGTADVAIATNGKSATFTDWDGDLVTIRTTRGTFDATQFKLSSPNPLTGGSHLIYADFTAATTGDEFLGANLTIIAKRGPGGGDGLVNIGTLDARGVTLGKVTIDGDLQQIDASALTGLTVYSLGQFAKAGVQGGPLTSAIEGKLGALTIKTDANRVTVGAQTIGAIKAGQLEEVTLAAQTIGAITAGHLKGVTLAAQTLGAIKAGHLEGVTLAAQTIGAIKALSLDDVNIFASGVLNPTTAAQALAIKSLTVTGSVKDSQILAGYDAAGAPVNADVAIGKVLVKGNWVASNLVAGVTAGADGIFATGDDTLFPGGNSIIAKIASITIGGAAFGTVDDLRDGFGFAAEEIGSLKVGKAKLPLQKGAANDSTPLPIGVTGDLRAREVG